MTATSCLLGLALLGAAPTTEVRGQIAALNLDKKVLTIDGRLAARGSTLTFALDGDTQVEFNRRAGRLDDLAAGQRVRVLYEVHDGKPLAKVVHVLGLGLGLGTARPGPAPAPKADDGAVTGVLRRVALTDREIVVIGPGAKGAETETTIQVPEAAKIVKGDRPAALEDLKEGDPARVQVERRDGKLQALSIQAGPGADKAAPKSNLIPRLRLALQIADQILKLMEDR
jgi:hypothetical protein